MNDKIPKLIIDNIIYGSHEIKWDLSILLYKDAVLESRRLVGELIENGDFGKPIFERLGFVVKIYEYFCFNINKGIAVRTIKGELEKLFLYFKWCEKLERNINEETYEKNFIDWANSTLEQVKLGKVKSYSNYKKCTVVARVLARSMGIDIAKPGIHLMNKTRLVRYKENLSLTTHSDELDFNKFGWFLKDISDGLSLDVVRGVLPIRLKLRNGKELVLKGSLMDENIEFDKYRYFSDKKNVLEARRALYPHESLLDKHKRSKILNLRIETELFIFINQTGMNLSQARSLKIDDYRWQTDNEYYSVFKVYKGRRQGEASFKCFKEYRVILQRYIDWLKSIGFNSGDSLFPYLSRGIIKADKNKGSPELIRDICFELDITYYNISKIRKSRSNWFDEKNESVEDIEEVMSHSVETFNKNYKKINFDKAIKEISNFNNQSIELLKSSGAGLCSSNKNPPISIDDDFDIKPDCSSQEGCLFCVYHRDILSFDYFFRLATHAYIKEIELSINPAIESHPAKLVINKINEKLDALSKVSIKEKKSVLKARSEVRSGNYHPEWADLIEILERMK
ncbi:hypothetical protein ACEWX4_13550 [Acinetobacter indicus]|uniref:hypothetical protein n=1 Tax=Acinetobacter indicus TaxID=756892 RepID=UPI0035BBFFC1